MEAVARISTTNIVQATRKHTATVYFFHGSGGTASNMKEWVDIMNREKLQFPHIKIVYPSAPSQHYTANKGMMQNIWFDRLAISNQVPENIDSIDSMCRYISLLIDQEVASGIARNRIILGGFSMGGSLSLHLTYRHKINTAGCFAMSSFLNKESAVYKHLKTNPEDAKIPLLQYHGTVDSLVPIEWAEESVKNLKEFGVNVKFVPLEQIEHELDHKEIQNWKNWLLNLLPDDI